MDRNIVIATVLIGLIMFVWLYFLSPTPPPPSPDQTTVDTLEIVVPPVEEEPAPLLTTPSAQPLTDSTLAGAQEGTERLITVETDLYQARFSTRGATLVWFQLKKYKKFDQQTPVQLVDTTTAGALGLAFQTPAGHTGDSRQFFFEPSFSGDVLEVTGDSATLSFTAQVGEGTIRQTYTFKPRTYEVGLRVTQQGASTFSSRDGYELVWYGGLPFTEALKNRNQEANSLGAYARSGGEVDGITLSEAFEEKPFRGSISWVAVKNKYFTAALIPRDNVQRADLFGERAGDLDAGTLKKSFVASLTLPPATGEPDAFRLYLGPLEYNRISKYEGLYGMVDYGMDIFEWVTRPLAKFVFIPAFTLLSKFIPNYGLVIIIFAFLIKVLLYPLTKTSYRSMARMRELQPKMQEIKEKFADNPQKQQEATMKLYKETGVNPVGGCLPMFLQYPIIIALWQFLQQSIEIRQQGFLWANDLSSPDVLVNLPFDIPFYGDFVAGFTVLMGLSMIVQMRIQATPATGAQAKIFMYLMPGVIFVIFNSLPSGLSLYYLCYNVVTAFQQKLINHQLEKEKEEGGADAKGKKPAKPSRLSKLSKNGRQRGSKSKKGSKKIAR